MISNIGFSQKLSRTEKKIRSYVEKQNDNAIDLIERVVNINSGSLNIDGNKEVGKIFQKELDKLKKTVKKNIQCFKESLN